MTNVSELVIVGIMVTAVMLVSVPWMRRTPIRSLVGLRNLDDLPFSGGGLVLLALLAAGDAVQVYTAIGTPTAVGVLLGALAGILGARWVFVPLGALAIATSLYDLFGRSSLQSTFAGAALLPLIVGSLLGVTLFGESRPRVLVAKGCAAVILTGFASSPLGADVIGTDPEIDITRIALTVVIAGVAGILFMLPGAGVSQLIGIGVGLVGLYGDQRAGGPAATFAIAFVATWVITSLLRRRLGPRHRGVR